LSPISTRCYGRRSTSSTARSIASSANSTTTSRRNAEARRPRTGSEVRSVELERLTAEGQTLVERRNAFEFLRDEAASHYERCTRAPWRPRAGSKVSHKHLTAAMIDSRDFIAARKRAEREILVPPGPKIVVTGGADFNDHRLIWDRLDKAHARHPDMTLIHGGSPKGAELIASKWATARSVPQIAFRPDWTAHAKAAPSSATTPCSKPCPSASWSSPATESRTTSPTRPASSASPPGGSRALREPAEPGRRATADPRPARAVAHNHSRTSRSGAKSRTPAPTARSLAGTKWSYPPDPIIPCPQE
jgi:hypothetical protein